VCARACERERGRGLLHLIQTYQLFEFWCSHNGACDTVYCDRKIWTFRGISCHHHQGRILSHAGNKGTDIGEWGNETRLLFSAQIFPYPEDGGNRYFRNVGTFLLDYTASHRRTHWSSVLFQLRKGDVLQHIKINISREVALGEKKGPITQLLIRLHRIPWICMDIRSPGRVTILILKEYEAAVVTAKPRLRLVLVSFLNQGQWQYR
jgi:hypothetical protein